MLHCLNFNVIKMGNFDVSCQHFCLLKICLVVQGFASILPKAVFHCNVINILNEMKRLYKTLNACIVKPFQQLSLTAHNHMSWSSQKS